MPSRPFASIEEAIEAIRAGRMVTRAQALALRAATALRTVPSYPPSF